MTRTFGVCAVALVAATAVALAAAQSREQPAAALSMGVPDAVNEHVTMAADGAWVALAWAVTPTGGGQQIHAAVSRDGGRTFGAPVRVSPAGSAVKVNGEQPPRVVLVPRKTARGGSGPAAAPEVRVVWTVGSDQGTRLVSARSMDAGHTFAAPAVVAGSDAPGNRGWESVTVDRDGRVLALWLDHRDTASDRPAADGHQHAGHQTGPSASSAAAADGVARAQRSQLFVAGLDGQRAASSVARGVCYCCKTSLVTGPDGAIYAAWRHVYAGNLRDIAFASSRDGGATFTAPARVSEDGWQIDGCPENGPALAVDARRRVHVVWPAVERTAGRESLSLFYAMTTDGRAFTPRVRMPAAGAAYHPQAAVTASGTLLVTWEEVIEGVRRVRVARAEAGGPGVRRFEGETASGVEPGVYPALAVTPTHAVLAWTSRRGTASVIQIRRIGG
jgi:hypothetical protein